MWSDQAPWMWPFSQALIRAKLAGAPPSRTRCRRPFSHALIKALQAITLPFSHALIKPKYVIRLGLRPCVCIVSKGVSARSGSLSFSQALIKAL